MPKQLWNFRLQIRPDRQQAGIVKGPSNHADHLDRQQQAQRASHGVQDELERGVIAVLTAPLADQEVHWHQANFPKDKEQQQVERHKDAQHARFQQQEQDHIRL
jgi:hypothetical protein